MSLWCMACSPLMIGCDIRKLDRDTAPLLMNQEVLAVNQDPLGIPGRRVADQSMAVAVINRGSRGEDVTVKARDLGLFDAPKLARNLWTLQDTAEFKVELPVRVQPHETVLWKVQGR